MGEGWGWGGGQGDSPFMFLFSKAQTKCNSFRWTVFTREKGGFGMKEEKVAVSPVLAGVDLLFFSASLRGDVTVKID